MQITGDAILRASLEMVISSRNPRAGDLDTVSRRSGHVIESAYLSPALAGERAGPYDVEVAAGAESFTWGPGGDVDALPPVAINYWAWVDESGYEYPVSPNGRLTTLKDWRQRSFLSTGGYPRLLYWQRDTDDAGRHILRFAPPADRAYTLRLYATVPALTEVRAGQTYELPAGVADYLICLLAVDAAGVFSYPVTPDLSARLRSAARGLSRVRSTPEARVTSPAWIHLDGRAQNVLWSGRF